MFRFLTVFAFVLVCALPALAEDIDFSADDGLEWSQKERRVTLTKNATAKTVDYTIIADVMEGFYHENNKIFLITAEGNVRADSATEQIRAARMRYDIEPDVITLFPGDGRPVILKNADTEIRSKEQAVYRRGDNFATTGPAEILHGGRTLFADRTKIMFLPEGGIDRVQAFGNIRLIDEDQELRGNQAEYNPTTGITVISGNVHFQKGVTADLSGDRIIYNMNTGVANVLPPSGGQVTGRFAVEGEAIRRRN
jgi:lipopolysaccharide export system protein LptA